MLSGKFVKYDKTKFNIMKQFRYPELHLVFSNTFYNIPIATPKFLTTPLALTTEGDTVALNSSKE